VDPVTHTLTGVTAANAFFRRRVGPEAVPILAVAANLPDLDASSYFVGGPRALLLRRTFGHSLLLIPIWAAALALILGFLYPRIRWRTRFGLALLGCAMHLFFDLINSFGVVLLWPLSDWRPELAIVFILDFILTGLLAAPLIAAVVKRLRPRLVALSRLSAASVAIYLALCGVSRAMAVRTLAAAAAAHGITPSFACVFPEPLGPHRWRGVVREGDLYHLYLLHEPSGRADPAGKVRSFDGDARVEAAKTSPVGQQLGTFFKAPVWQVKEGGGPAGGARGDPGALVAAYDLRFRTLVLDRKAVFEYVFRVGAGGVDVVSW
jgi:inner membrane protein